MLKNVKYFFLLGVIFLFIVLVVIIRGANSSIRQQLKNLPLFSFFIAQHDENKQRAYMTVLNHAIPPQHYLAAFLGETSSLDKKMISGFNGYLDYYQKVTEYFPNNADAYALLGFSYYHLGLKDKAIHFYQKAVYLDGSFFWHFYNLGILYVQKGENILATKYLKEALKLNPDLTLKTIYLSKVYQQIKNTNKEYDILKELKKGYRKASFILILSKAYAEKKIKIPVKDVFRQKEINLKIF